MRNNGILKLDGALNKNNLWNICIKTNRKKNEWNGFIKLYVNCTWMYAAPGLKKNSNGRPLGTINLQLCKLSCAKIIYLKRCKNMIVYLVALQDVIPCVIFISDWMDVKYYVIENREEGISQKGSINPVIWIYPDWLFSNYCQYT